MGFNMLGVVICAEKGIGGIGGGGYGCGVWCGVVWGARLVKENSKCEFFCNSTITELLSSIYCEQ